MLHIYYMYGVPQKYHNWRELFNIKIQKSPLTFGESTSQGRYQVLYEQWKSIHQLIIHDDWNLFTHKTFILDFMLMNTWCKAWQCYCWALSKISGGFVNYNAMDMDKWDFAKFNFKTNFSLLYSLGPLVGKQGKSEGFDSCDRPSNLTQIGFKSSIFQSGNA